MFHYPRLVAIDSCFKLKILLKILLVRAFQKVTNKLLADHLKFLFRKRQDDETVY